MASTENEERLRNLRYHRNYDESSKKARRLELELRECDEIERMKKPVEPKIPRRKPLKAKMCLVIAVCLGIAAGTCLFSEPLSAIICAILAYAAYRVYKSIDDIEDTNNPAYKRALDEYCEKMEKYKKKENIQRRREMLEELLINEQAMCYNYGRKLNFTIPTELNTYYGRQLIDEYVRSGRCSSVEDACMTIQNQLQLLRATDQLKDLNEALRKLLEG